MQRTDEIQIDLTMPPMGELDMGVQQAMPQQVQQAMPQQVQQAMPQQVQQVESGGIVNIGEMKLDMFMSFYNLLDFISKGMSADDIISISNGELNISKLNGFIECNLEAILGKHDLAFNDSQKIVKMLKVISSGIKVMINDDVLGEKYIITNFDDTDQDIFTIRIPKVEEDIPNNIAAQVGKRLFSSSISSKDVSDLLLAKSISDTPHFTLTFSKDMARLLTIDIGSGVTRNIGHVSKDEIEEGIKYKVLTLFPISNVNQDVLVEIFEIPVTEDNPDPDPTDFIIRTSSDTAVSTVKYSEKISIEKDYNSFDDI